MSQSSRPLQPKDALRRLPPLVALRAFEAVARTGSVRAAGEELAVSHTVISRHLRNLEERIETKLMTAQGRGLSLTEAGARFFRQITRAFDIIAVATSELSGSKRRALDIHCAPGLADRLLLSSLPALQAKLANWDIILRPTIERPNLLTSEVVAEIIYCDKPETHPGLHAQMLAQPRVFPVATAALRDRMPGIATVDDLLLAPLIHEESTEQWAHWLRAAGLDSFGPLRGPRLWHADVAIQAARQGQGIALANELLVKDEVGNGALIELLSTHVRLGAYYLVGSAEHWNGAAMCMVREWLADLFDIA
jgi:LysR family glycine cleavage system transcriptional activator